MNHLSHVPEQSGNLEGLTSFHASLSDSEMSIREERIAFTVRIVSSEQDMNKAVGIRHAAYARHMPEFAERLRAPESMDGAPGVVVLLAESKLDGTALGTLRIQTNAHTPLKVEQSVGLPLWMRDRPLAEVTRLGITSGTAGRLVKMVLIKAAFEYCEFDEIEWAIVAARPPLDRQYSQLMFEEIDPDQGLVPLRHVDNILHRVMAFEIETGHQRWSDANHPMLNFFSYTNHPDIELNMPRPAKWGELFPHISTARYSRPLSRRPV